MNTYPNLIAEVCGTDKTTENVSKAIPILIRWAQSGITNNHYEDLNRELWKNADIGEFIRNDRFLLYNVPKQVEIKIRKTYTNRVHREMYENFVKKFLKRSVPRTVQSCSNKTVNEFGGYEYEQSKLFSCHGSGSVHDLDIGSASGDGNG